MLPKLDSMKVKLRSSAVCDRAVARGALEAIEFGAQLAPHSALLDVPDHRHEQAVGRIDRHADVDLLG